MIVNIRLDMPQKDFEELLKKVSKNNREPINVARLLKGKTFEANAWGITTVVRKKQTTVGMIEHVPTGEIQGELELYQTFKT